MNLPDNDREKDVFILIVDDNPDVCSILEKYSSKKGMRAKSITDPLKLLEHVKDNPYDVILLDVVFPHVSGLELIPQVKGCCPDTKVIIMTGYPDKDTAIESLRVGAFDFLEKPIDYALFSHAVGRALDVRRAERKVRNMDKALAESHDNLLACNNRLEVLNHQLVENNQALSALAKNIELARKESAREIVLKTRSLILPILERLQNDRKLVSHQEELNTLTHTLEDMTADLASELELSMLLTPSELRIASLIRNGLVTDAIALHLNLAPGTIKTHRKKIRKKLGISNMRYSLRDYLRSEFGTS